MPLVRISLIAVVLALTCFVSTVGAQKPHVALQNPPTWQIIITRPFAERVATARRVLNNPHVQLVPSDSFVLTPRRPYVDGRGALDSNQAYTDLQSPDTGHIAPWGDGEVSLHLFHTSGKRFLIDCRVKDYSDKPWTYLVRFYPTNSTVQMKAVNGLLSFVAPLGADGAVIGIYDHKGQFSLMGCELTKLD